MFTQADIKKQHEALDKAGIQHVYECRPEGSRIYFPGDNHLSEETHIGWSPYHGLYVSPWYTLTNHVNIDDRLAGLKKFREIISYIKP